MSHQLLLSVLLALTVFLTACGTYPRRGLDPVRARQVQAELLPGKPALSPELAEQILALNPDAVSAGDIEMVLARAPAPRIILIHGGVGTVIDEMQSFAEFLMGMGYPGSSLTNPGDGTYTFSCYESSEKIAGALAWYYEQEGLRPMLVGHSQGGMQVVKVLHRLAGRSAAKLRIYNPLTWEWEARREFSDPLTGRPRSLAGWQLPFASSVGAGGLTRALPNQWEMNFKLRIIPDSAEEFTGFCKKRDLLGGDFLGYGAANHYHASGTASVRNVWLPTEYRHGKIPDTKHLLRSEAMRDWIHRYQPPLGDVVHLKLETELPGDSRHILWAAEMWHSLKKHWVLELQRYLRATRLGDSCSRVADENRRKAELQRSPSTLLPERRLAAGSSLSKHPIPDGEPIPSTSQPAPRSSARLSQTRKPSGP